MSTDKNVLFTGGTGFVGRNVLPILSADYNILAPSRHELDLKDGDAVARYVAANDVRVIVHSANPNPVKSSQFDAPSAMFEDSLRTFMNIYRARNDVERILYFGSGAEFDKSKDIVRIKEEEAFRSLPPDVYGCSKYIMNELASKAENVVNLRLFGCFGPTDHDSKFITHCVRSILEGKTITIRQDCRFDYLHVFDVARVIAFFIDHEPRYADYNVASGKSYLLSEIARIVCDEMSADVGIQLLSSGLNNEYTANVDRLAAETGLPETFMSLEQGVRIQIESERDGR